MAASDASFERLEPVLCELVVESFQGETDVADNYNGKGQVNMRNGCTYNGQFRGGLFHGLGRLTWANGVIYEGSFQLGTIEGQGCFKWPDGSSYKGGLVAGKRCGFGLFMCSAGQIYEGNWLDGLRHGKGSISYREQKSTTVYTGDWVRGLREGYGLMKYASGNTYEGFWKADKKHGMGLMLWLDKDNVYAGEWKDDLPHGQGENLWANVSLNKLVTKQLSSIYRGEWQGGVRHGDGSFFYSDGSQYAGQWSHGEKNGNGVILYGDGRINPARFEKGQNVLQLNSVAPPLPPPVKSASRGGTHGERGSATAVSASPSSRADELVSDDVHLHVRDLLQALPKADHRRDPTLEFVSASRVYVDNNGTGNPKTDSRELERLLLRFNSTLKQIYARLVESVHRDARRFHLQDTLEKTNFSDIDKAISTALVHHQKFFCMSLQEMKAYCREIGLLGPHFTSHQVSTAFHRCIEEHKLQADYAYIQQQLLDRTKVNNNNSVAVGSEAPPSISAHSSAALLAEVEVPLPKVCDLYPSSVGPTAVSRDALDPDQPICEQVFYNVLVRCLTVSDMYVSALSPAYDARGVGSNDGSPRMPLMLPHALLLAMKQMHTQHEQKVILPPLLAALGSEKIQEVLRNSRKLLQVWWEQCTQLAAADGVSDAKQGAAQLRHVVKVFMKLRGRVIRERVTVTDLLRVLQAPWVSVETRASAPRPQTAAAAPQETTANPDAEPSAATSEPIPVHVEGVSAVSRPATALAAVPRSFDISTLLVLMDIDDFTEKICRLVMSDAWCFVDPMEAAAAEVGSAELAVEQALLQRLQALFANFNAIVLDKTA